MRVTLSVALTADGYMDDKSDRRLILSTPGDWQAVYALRAENDAILAGAETLRRDDPTLLIRDEERRALRVSEGLAPDIAKVTLSASGRLSPDLKFFHTGEGERYVFSNREIPELNNLATVISTNERITAKLVVTELEKRGIERLMVEGGERTLAMFLDEGMADVLRVAVNPHLKLGQEGSAKFAYCPPQDTPCRHETVDGMEVSTYTLRADTSAEDLRCLRMAIAEGQKCRPSRTSYSVGAVVVTADGQLFGGYTHESSPTHHAEQEAIRKALAAGATLHGATIYSSMEPCSKRASEPESCTQLIIRHGFRRVVFALYEPDRFVHCRGALTLREAGLDVRAYPSLAGEVRAANAHLKF